MTMDAENERSLRPSRGPRRLLWIVGGVLLALVVANGVILAVDDPMLAVHEHADRLGHPPESLEPLGGGYESRFLGRRAYGDFVVVEDGAEQHVHVEIARPTPLHGWRLVTYSKEPHVR